MHDRHHDRNALTRSRVQALLAERDEFRTTVLEPEVDVAFQIAQIADVLVLDHQIEDRIIFHLLRALYRIPSETSPLLINAPSDPQQLVGYVERGFVGYITEDDLDERLADMVSIIAQQQVCLPPDIIPHIIERYRQLRSFLPQGLETRRNDFRQRFDE
ncbi:MAG: hypothetical protein R2849_21780 [Thermomicrobiales bacterium]